MKRTSKPMTISLLLALCATGFTTSSALAQPERGPGQSEPGMNGSSFEGDPAEHLRERIAEIEGERAQLHEALTRLDAGEPWSDVRAGIQRRRGGSMDDAKRLRDRAPGKMDEPRMLEILQEIDPEAATRYGQMHQRNPRFAGRLLHSMGPRLVALARLKEINPPLFEVEAEEFRIERQIMLTARTLHMAIAGVDNPEPDDSVDDTRDRLHDLVGRQLDLQIEGQRIKLESAEHKIERLRNSIEEHADTRDSVIDDRVERIMERAVRGGANRRQRGGPDRGRDGGPPRQGQRRGKPDRP